MCGGGGVVEVGSVVAVVWCRSIRVVLVVLIVECAVVVAMQYNGRVIVEDVVDVVVLVELRIGGLASISSSIEKAAVVHISSWELASFSNRLFSEIIAFSYRLFRVSLSTWLSMTYEM